jgi:TetR/AcrR family transcriptional regulator, cholesterol catabolism regulator
MSQNGGGGASGVRRRPDVSGNGVKKVSRREEQIIAEALKLFSQGGFQETSLQEIADRLGVTRQAFYYYFKSKDDLLWHLVGGLGDQLLVHAEPIAQSDQAPTEKLRRLLESHLHTLLDNSEAFRIYFSERHLVGKSRDRRLKQGEERYLDLITEVIAVGQADGSFEAGSPRILARLVNGYANSVIRWYRPQGELSSNEVSLLAAQMIVAGLIVPQIRSAPSTKAGL